MELLRYILSLKRLIYKKDKGYLIDKIYLWDFGVLI